MRLADMLPIFAGVATVAYPFLVYFGLTVLPPGVMVALAIGIGGLHLLRGRGRGDGLLPPWGFLVIVCVLLGLLGLRPVLAMKAYPPVFNLCLAATFAWSLLRPPTVIERIARLTKPNLPPEGIAYTRNVTKVWIVFFLANAAIASACALWASVAVWTLWNGLIAYLLVGALFAGELLYRRHRLRRATT